MKKTCNIDDDLLREAKKVSGAATDTETIRLGLEALVRRAAYQRMRAYLGTEPDAQDVSRRREKPAATRRVA
jgi:Arc/MetJ family transcription regulator